MQEDDTIASFHDLPPRDEAFITYDSPFPNVCLNHKDALGKEDEFISNFLDSLLSQDVSLEKKNLVKSISFILLVMRSPNLKNLLISYKMENTYVKEVIWKGN